jgi:hypothetical protein
MKLLLWFLKLFAALLLVKCKWENLELGASESVSTKDKGMWVSGPAIGARFAEAFQDTRSRVSASDGAPKEDPAETAAGDDVTAGGHASVDYTCMYVCMYVCMWTSVVRVA